MQNIYLEKWMVLLVVSGKLSTRQIKHSPRSSWTMVIILPWPAIKQVKYYECLWRSGASRRNWKLLKKQWNNKKQRMDWLCANVQMCNLQQIHLPPLHNKSTLRSSMECSREVVGEKQASWRLKCLEDVELAAFPNKFQLSVSFATNIHKDLHQKTKGNKRWAFILSMRLCKNKIVTFNLFANWPKFE